MTNRSFLDQVAQMLLREHATHLPDTMVVLPNKRARIFLLEALRKQTTQTIFAPRIVSIEKLIQDIAGIRSIDAIEQLFEFYEVYCAITEAPQRQEFDVFANWAKTLLQDFNEIDRYLLEPDRVLRYLQDIKEIEHWSVDITQQTPLIESYLSFWKMLPDYYRHFYDHLLQKGVGYQGMIYREAVANLNHFSESQGSRMVLFCGFNALNAAEEQIIQHLLALDLGRIYWDADQTFLSDTAHDAGLFLRDFKSKWKHYNSHPFEWIFNDFAQEKTIEVIGTPKSVGQAKIAGGIIDKLIEGNHADINRVAMVLGEESLLIPVLHVLPQSVGALNITMGYSAKNNPAQTLIFKLFRMHTVALSRGGSNAVFYYKDVLDVLGHPLVEPYVAAQKVAQTIKQYNYTFLTHRKIAELHPNPNRLFSLLFEPWTDNPTAVLDTLSEVLLTIKSSLGNDNEQAKVTKAFVYAVFQTLNKLKNYYAKYANAGKVDTLFAIYKQVIDLAEVSFEGEPLEGLQIMGVLESRVLDFDTVVITSMNEGKFPAGKSQNSFIPYDVKVELGLPTFKQKDAIYTYHFYHLLQRAKKIYLLYNTESEGLDAGEPSRFLTQLEVERQPKHTTTKQIYSAVLPDVGYEPKEVPKSAAVMARLEEIATAGFSPSALTSYIRNPIDFYFQKILRIRETEEVEENIALNTLGTIIHGALETLYTPMIGRRLTEADIDACFGQLEAVVLDQFKQVYKEGEIRKGKNLLAFEVAKRNVSNFLKLEREDLRSGAEIEILELEKKCEGRELRHPNLPYPVRVSGTVDRIERHNGRLRIIDYKTGKVEKSSLTLKTWDGLTADIKSDKIIQLLAYAFMYEPLADGEPVEVGIISFKNLKSGFMPLVFKDMAAPTETTLVTGDLLQAYQEELTVLLGEILDPEIPFTEKVI
ncbi:PD-(D/E)XK nuclease family protein [Flavobacterium caeni]|uniref:PD-(D/E)XK nuclease superfamily protein n=1 Tax=Flavobacterium caeni TaxID=490189 RepID=A0A1G5H2E0_9FLAO|nr:PD-(D/E)XK nuclease family protein [Flavobacterium caeni]SCY57946.1 PD-(D/E)XK nuclease superfamily protein [Flavobacterium caeni]